jgi:hypothetical protein
MTKVRREAKVRRDDAAAESGAMTPPKKAVSLTRTNGRARSERPARRRHDRASFLLPWPFGPLRAASAQRQALWGSEGGEAEHRCLRENSREARRPRNPQRGHAFCTATVFGPAGSRTIGVVTVRSSPPLFESGRDSMRAPCWATSVPARAGILGARERTRGETSAVSAGCRP